MSKEILTNPNYQRYNHNLNTIIKNKICTNLYNISDKRVDQPQIK